MIVWLGCAPKPQPLEKAEGEWIKGSAQEQLDAIEQQFRGFDMAMVETGYRYQELYWAGTDRNWPYATYQAKKLRKAIDNGLIRRPKRATSAQPFLNEILPQVEQAVANQDSLAFDAQFKLLTTGCNACHAKEKVSAFTVQVPQQRISPIRR